MIAMNMFQAFVTVENSVLRITPVSPVIFSNRLPTTRLRLPRQPASANGATKPGFSGPFPS